MIPPPSISTVQAFSDTREQGAWVDLLKAAEPMVSQDIFWIDLNRMVAEALAGLGSGYQAAHEAVCMETAFFMHRFPGVATLTFATGMPFADADTIAWLKGISLGSGMAMEAPLSVAGDDGSPEEQSRIADTLNKARELAGKKKIVDAVTLLQEKMQGSRSRKEEMMWRMSLCQVLVAAKQATMALPHMELIVENIDTYQLETWDPDFSIKALKLVWQAYKAQSDKAIKEKAGDILSRISRLSPAEALGLK
jgi:type VI secretion system protein VasJ